MSSNTYAHRCLTKLPTEIVGMMIGPSLTTPEPMENPWARKSPRQSDGRKELHLPVLYTCHRFYDIGIFYLYGNTLYCTHDITRGLRLVDQIKEVEYFLNYRRELNATPRVELFRKFKIKCTAVPVIPGDRRVYSGGMAMEWGCRVLLLLRNSNIPIPNVVLTINLADISTQRMLRDMCFRLHGNCIQVEATNEDCSQLEGRTLVREPERDVRIEHLEVQDTAADCEAGGPTVREETRNLLVIFLTMSSFTLPRIVYT